MSMRMRMPNSSAAASPPCACAACVYAHAPLRECALLAPLCALYWLHHNYAHVWLGKA
jgi:hypothetical protein